MTLKGVDLKADSSGRARRTISFSVNLLNDDEKFIHDILRWWKAQRKMATNVRKAILLFYDLAQGNTARLQEYFPHVVEALTGQAVQDHADSIVGRMTDVLDDRVGEITQQFVAMPTHNQRVLEAQTERIGRQLEADETLIEVKPSKKASSQDVANNFLASMGNLFN